MAIITGSLYLFICSWTVFFLKITANIKAFSLRDVSSHSGRLYSEKLMNTDKEQVDLQKFLVCHSFMFVSIFLCSSMLFYSIILKKHKSKLKIFGLINIWGSLWDYNIHKGKPEKEEWNSYQLCLEGLRITRAFSEKFPI